MKAKKGLSLTLLAVLTLSAVGCGTNVNSNLQPIALDPGVGAFAAGGKSGDVIPGEFIVKFKKTAKNAATLLNSAGATKVKDIGGVTSGVQLIKLDNVKNSNSVFNNLSKNSSIEYIEPNRIITLPKIIRELLDKITGPREHSDGAFPNDPMFSSQWHHKTMESEKGWELSKGSKDVTIAILDTGIDGEHPDLKGKLAKGYDAYGNGKEYVDKQGHGTHCAGIASAKTHNGVGVAGVAPDATLMSVKVLQDSGSGTYAAVADGIMWAAKNPDVDIMSMSLGGPSSSKAIEDAVNEALKNGKVVVAAMGNDGSNRPSYPASIKGVFAVGATNQSDAKANFSQWGQNIQIAAPGVDIYATFPTYSSGMPGKNYGAISGTSMATPAVAGLAGLLKGANPSLKGEQITKIIASTADDLGNPGFDDKFGAGRINVAKAVAAAKGVR